MIEGFEKQTFNGPPEGVRDTVMCATKYLIDGEWASAAHCIKSMSIWTLLPGLEGGAFVLDLVVEEIKQEALRTFIFQRASQYDTLRLDTLSDMFALSVESVQANVSKLLTTGGLTGSCDAPTSTFAVHTLEPSTLQSAVTLLAENVAVFLDANERALGIRVESDAATAFEDEDLGFKHRGYRNSQYEDREVNKLKKSRSTQGKYSRQKLVISAGERDSRGRKQDTRDRLRGELLQFSGGKLI
jgi:translation initiation factor 3 subunit C